MPSSATLDVLHGVARDVREGRAAGEAEREVELRPEIPDHLAHAIDDLKTQGVPVVAIAEMGTKSILFEGKGALIAPQDEQGFAERVLGLPKEAR